MLSRIATLALVLGAFQGPGMPQRLPNAPPSGLIVGQVVDAASGRPVPRAIVTLSGLTAAPAADPRGMTAPGAPPRVLTGSDGRFVFRNLPRGNFGLSAMRTGYTPSGYGVRRPGGPSQQVAVGDGERIGDATIRMWKQGAISGMVLDESGERLVGVRVRIMARGGLPDPSRLNVVRTVTTDDRGVYRAGLLDARDYIVGVVSRTVAVPASLAPQTRPGTFTTVSAEIGGTLAPGTPTGIEVGDSIVGLSAAVAIPPPPKGTSIMVYPPAFYPSVPDAGQATPISLASGEDREGVDIRLQPVPTVRVSGALGGAASDIGGVPLRLVPATGGDVVVDGDLPGTITVAERDGRFTFAAVPSGEYVLRATTRLRFGPSTTQDIMYAEVPLTVGALDIDGVTVIMRPGLRIGGSFQFEGSSPRPGNLGAVALAIEPAAGSSAGQPFSSSPKANNDGDFEAGGLPPGRYYVRVLGSPPGWMFKSATLNGRDVADTAIDLRDADAPGVVITFSDRWSGLSGTVLNTAGAPDPDALVVVFPTDPATWNSAGFNPRRVKSVRPSKSGAYNFATLPPGDYYVAALPDSQAADWRDARFLEMATRVARQVTIGDGERRTQDLRTREVR